MIKLNLARNCLRYLIRAYDIGEIYVPYYSCNSLWKAIREEKCKIRFYHLNSDFMPTQALPQNSYILYINYFGLCTQNCRDLEQFYPNLIVDNTQAFYSGSFGLADFNSYRKFFPVQNGACLRTKKILTEAFEQDKFLFDPVSILQDYKQFVKNELLLDKEGIKYIYPQVEKEMENIDFEKDKTIRRGKYFEYHQLYGSYNWIKLTPKDNEIPYCYPFSTDKEDLLKDLKTKYSCLLMLWGEVPSGELGYETPHTIVALPLTLE